MASWGDFIRMIPTVFEFVKSLNLPPKTTLVTATGLIFGIAYSYKYFKPNNLRKIKNEEIPDNMELENSELLSTSLDENGLSLGENKLIPIDEEAELHTVVPTQEDLLGTRINSSTNSPKLLQHIANADQVFGSIENTGENQSISIGCKSYNKSAE